MKWKIFYGDNSTFSSEQGSWEQAPQENVQVIMEYRQNEGRAIHMGFDYYAKLDDETIIEFNDTDLKYWLVRLESCRGIKIGRFVTNQTWKQIHDKAFNDVKPPLEA